MEENRKEAEFERENYVICLKVVIAEISPTKVGEKGRLLTLTEFSKRWNYTQLEKNLKKLEKKVLVHKKGYRDFTDIKRSLQYSDVTTSKPKKN